MQFLLFNFFAQCTPRLSPQPAINLVSNVPGKFWPVAVNGRQGKKKVLLSQCYSGKGKRCLGGLQRQQAALIWNSGWKNQLRQLRQTCRLLC